MLTVLALLFGALVGILLGTCGGGGATLIVPALVYGMSIPAGEATRLSHVIVGISSLLTASMYWSAGQLRWSVALLLAAAGAGGAYLGRLTCHSVPDAAIMASLGVVLIVASRMMLRGVSGTDNAEQAAESETDETTKLATILDLSKLLLAGLGIGFLTGFLGVGGGFIIVPVLVVVIRLPMRLAVGTSLAVIAMNCAASLSYDGVRGVQWAVVLPFLAASIAGCVVGYWLSRRTPGHTLQRWFAKLTLAVGIVIILKSLSESLP